MQGPTESRNEGSGRRRLAGWLAVWWAVTLVVLALPQPTAVGAAAPAKAASGAAKTAKKAEPLPENYGYTMGFEDPQLKINWVDVSKAPEIKIFASMLDRRLKPIRIKQIKKFDVLSIPPGAGASQAHIMRSFLNGVLPRGVDGKLEIYSKAGISSNVVAVVAGFQDPALRRGTLGEGVRAAAGLILKKVGEKDHVNVIWYNDRLYTYINEEGKTAELTDIGYQNVAKYCHEKRLKWLRRWGEKPEKPEKKEDQKKEATEFECGLLADFGNLGKILKRMDFRGFYPRLMGHGAAPLCSPPQFKSFDADTSFARGIEPDYGGAIDEAFKMLVLDGDMRQPKYLLLVSDGRDGYIQRQDECRQKQEFDLKKTLLLLEQDCKNRPGGRAAIKACGKDINLTQMTDQAKERLQSDLIRDQKRFQQKRLRQWLTLAYGANIRVYAVGLPSGMDHERDRLAVLAFNSGGTYREVKDVTSVADVATDMMDEIANQFVITFDAGLLAGQTYHFLLKATLQEGGAIKSQVYDFFVPTSQTGLGYKINKLIRWLERKVGSPWHIVIIVAACVVVAFLIFLLFWKIIKMIRKKVKEAKKKAQAAAKAAATAAAKGAVPKR